MFRFVKQIIISAMMLFNSLLNVNPLECIAMKNRECKVRSEIVNVNSNNPMFYPLSVKINKCSGNCNNIHNDPYARMCRKKLADKLIDECTKTIEETKLANITFTENENNYEHNSCKVYIVLMTIAFTIFTGITVYLVYYRYVDCNKYKLPY